MGVSVSSSNNGVKFSTSISSPTQITILMWFKGAAWDPTSTGYNILDLHNNSAPDWSINSYTSVGTTYIGFSDFWSTMVGNWRTPTPTLNAIHHYALEYDGASTSNNASIWIDNTSQTFEKTSTPSGSRISTGTNFQLGNDASGYFNTQTGTWYSICVYNRLISTGEITDAYNSRLTIPNTNGLVFATGLSGASGIQVFDGTTLSSSNKFVDLIGGGFGVPSGSPAGTSDNYLNINSW